MSAGESCYLKKAFGTQVERGCNNLLVSQYPHCGKDIKLFLLHILTATSTITTICLFSPTEIPSDINPLGLMPIGEMEFAILLQDIDVDELSTSCSNDPRSSADAPLIPGLVRGAEEVETLIKLLTQLVQAGTLPANKQIHFRKHNITLCLASVYLLHCTNQAFKKNEHTKITLCVCFSQEDLDL